MGTKQRVVLDTNVWVSIFLKRALAEEFERLFVAGNIDFCVSQAILEEVARVLLYPKFSALFDSPEFALNFITRVATIVKPSARVTVIKEDAADNRILECAKAAGADFIVSGDRHLLRLKKFGKAKIVTPREFIDITRGSL